MGHTSFYVVIPMDMIRAYGLRVNDHVGLDNLKFFRIEEPKPVQLTKLEPVEGPRTCEVVTISAQ